MGNDLVLVFVIGIMGHKIPECQNVATKRGEGYPQGQIVPRGQVQEGSQTLGGGLRGALFYALHAGQ